jgi:hypothetical protein
MKPAGDLLPDNLGISDTLGEYIFSSLRHLLKLKYELCNLIWDIILQLILIDYCSSTSSRGMLCVGKIIHKQPSIKELVPLVSFCLLLLWF